jgi:hypothetical protein
MLAGFALVALAVFAVAGPASAVNEYTGGLSSNAATPGATLTYSAPQTGFPDSVATVTMTPDAEFLTVNSTTYTTSPTGALAFSVRLPGTAAIGQTFVLTVAVGQAPGNFEDSETITIVALPADADGTALTGIDPAPLLWFGGGLLVLGIAVIGVLVAVRRGQRVDPAG